MIKWQHILITLFIGIIIGILISAYWPSNESGVEDPQVGHLKQELGWRDLNEKKTIKRIEKLVKDSSERTKVIADLRTKANQSETKLKEHRKEAQPLTTKDTISFVIEDISLCDSALLHSKQLASALTIEVMTDEAIIKGQGELIDSLQVDKIQLKKIDSLYVQTEKQLRKANRKKFFRGLGIGGALGAIIMALLL